MPAKIPMSPAGRARAERKRRQFETAGKAAVVAMGCISVLLLVVLSLR